MGSLRLTSVLYTRLSGFMDHVSGGGSVWDACREGRISYLMSPTAMCCGSKRLLCVRLGRFGVCRRLCINHFLLIVWVLVLLKKFIAEMYVHRALLIFLSSAKPRPMKNNISQSLGLDLVNIDVYAEIYQNIPLSLRDKAIFTFSEFGTRQSLDR